TLAPWLATTVGEHDRALLWCRVECSLQLVGNRDRDISASLSLAHLDHTAVVGTPWQVQQIALSLSGIDRGPHRQPQIGWGGSQEPRDLFVAPNLVNASTVIKLAAFGAWIGLNQAALDRPRENACQGAINIVGLPQGRLRQLITPFEKDVYCTRVV